MRPSVPALALVLGLGVQASAQEPAPPHAEEPAPPAPKQEPAAPPRPPDSPAVRLPEVVVTPARRAADPFGTPAVVRAAAGEVLFERRARRTVPEALGDVPGVGVQKTSQGQGSPYLRGFTGFRTLTLLDGLRLNNSVYRDGPNEYTTLVDPAALDRLEVVEGPGSVLYGSDAVGGTVNLLTRRVLPDHDPEDRATEATWERRLGYRYGSADRSSVARGEVAGRLGTRFGARAGGTWADYDDVDGGRHVGVQPRTGYESRSGDVAAEWQPAPGVRLRAAALHTTQEDAWRTHATVFGLAWHGTTVGTDLARVLDHERTIGALHLDAARLGDLPVRDLRLSLSAGRLAEEQDQTRASGSRNVQSLVATTYQGAVHATTPLLGGRLLYGLDWARDLVQSARRNFAAGTGLFTGSSIQGPVGDDARYDLLGAFLEAEAPLARWLEATAGVRGTWADARAGAVQDPATGGEVTVEDSWANLSGAGRVLLRPDETFRAFVGLAQSFRAPNLSDLTRLDTARSGELEVPSPDLRPERYLTFEVGARWREPALRLEAAWFYTWISDYIDRTPTGNVVAGQLEVRKRNTGDGYVQGASGSAEIRFVEGPLRGIRATLGASWAEGAVDTYPTSAPVKERRPLSKVPPATFLARLGFEPAGADWFVEADVRAARRQERLSPGDERDTQRIPVGGTPGYAVFGLRAGATLAPKFRVHAGIENLGDKDYRHHGSGVNEPGQHAVVGGTLEF
ncbi:MAG: TonB-dependent receptor [Planctomycetales bacterium]|nr:TonB-dependent receptor [Planctomycetales bacterium]